MIITETGLLELVCWMVEARMEGAPAKSALNIRAAMVRAGWTSRDRVGSEGYLVEFTRRKYQAYPLHRLQGGYRTVVCSTWFGREAAAVAAAALGALAAGAPTNHWNDSFQMQVQGGVTRGTIVVLGALEGSWGPILVEVPKKEEWVGGTAA